MNTNTHDILRQAAMVWNMRAAGLELRRGTKRRQHDLEAYLQGVLAVATAAEVMSLKQADLIALLVAAGRAEEQIETWSKLPE